MKNKIHLSILFSFFIVSANAQLDCMQGIWKDKYNGSNLFNEYHYLIAKDHNALIFSFTGGEEDNLVLNEAIEGFLDDNPKDTDKGRINVYDLRKDGKYYVLANINNIDEEGFFQYEDHSTPYFFDCEIDKNLTIAGKRPTEYIRMDGLPSFLMKLIKNKADKDDIDYVRRYLNIQIREVQVEQCIIFSKPGQSTNMNLQKGDFVTVLEEKLDWIRIEFLSEQRINGWVKKENLK